MNKKHFLSKFLLPLCTFSIVSVFTTISYAESWQRCYGLHVKINDQVLSKYEVVGDPEMIHGDFEGCHIKAGMCSEYMFVQDLLFGPEVKMTFKNKKTDEVFQVDIQQNYCFISAGDIHVKPLSGQWEYTVNGGSFYTADGVVDILSIK